MESIIDRRTSRRRFLQFMASSPLFAAGGAFANEGGTGARLPDPMMWAPLPAWLAKGFGARDATRPCWPATARTVWR